MTENPLLIDSDLPHFSAIKAEDVESAIDHLLAECRKCLENICASTQQASWESHIQPWIDVDERLSQAWSPVSHLHSVMDSEALRSAYEQCVVKISDYHSETGQNRELYRMLQEYARSQEFGSLDIQRRKTIEDMQKDFELSGVALEGDARESFRQKSQQKTRLATRFSNNVLDATMAWEKPVDDAQSLSGLPDSAMGLLAQNAAGKGKQGWLITLHAPSYMPVMTYADNRELRKELYHAFVTRASDQGPNAGEFDNTAIMQEMLEIRHEQASMLGFANYAEYSLARKMANNSQQVIDFLLNLANKARPAAESDLEELKSFAQKKLGIESLEAWDVAYASEKLRQQQYHFSDEEVRPYFPVDSALEGMLDITSRLFQVRFNRRDDVDTWHPDVVFYDILDANNQAIAGFYMDLFARDHKRGGAWMDVCRSRSSGNKPKHLPIAYLTCNFSPPLADTPSLLTHDELTTLYHEFGHGLHHMMTRIEVPPVGGINGVEWDAVELPSQFMENFCWEEELLHSFARHYKTGEALPGELFAKMLSARHFHAGLFLLRQLEFGLFDFRMHSEYKPGQSETIQKTLNRVREEVAVIIPPDWNRFAHGFGHIFGGGYAAGYYSYLWAEQLSADVFEAFREEGLLNPDTGKRYLDEILSVGSSRPAMESFKAFRGREPIIEPLLRSYGIAA